MSLASDSFVGFISSLVASGEFNTVHDKLTSLFDQSYRNSCEENTAICCELIEEHARLQGQLFRLLELCSADGGVYGGSESLKKCLLPWLSKSFVASRHTGQLEQVENEREKYQKRNRKLEEDFKESQKEIAELRLKLNNAGIELNANETELKQWRKETQELRKESIKLHQRLQKQILSDADAVEAPRKHTTKPYTNGDEPFQNHSAKLVEKFTAIYNNERRELMDLLRGFAGQDTNEQLVFSVVEECFTVCRSEQRKMRKRVQHALQPKEGVNIDVDRVEEIVENYMKTNTENQDIEPLIQGVMKGLHRNHDVCRFIPFNEKLLVPFTRETLRVSWSMLALYPPIDIAMALDGDVINEARYRRMCNSEFSASGIHHYVWPALLRDGRVVTKGEVVTRRLHVGDSMKTPPSIVPSPKARSAEPLPELSPAYDLGFGSMSSSLSDYFGYKPSYTF